MRSLIFVLMSFLAASNLYAMGKNCGMHTLREAYAEEEKVMEVGNKIYPISGETINEETKTTYEHEGKIYNFCCPMCIDKFRGNPEKYIADIEKQQKKAAEEQKQTEESEATEEGHNHEHHH